MALLHQFKISKGRVTYKSRFLASDSYQSNQENNRIAVSEFGTITMPDPCKNFFQRFLSRFELPSKSFIRGMNVRICNRHVKMHTWHYQRYINIFSPAPLEPSDNANVSFVTYKGDFYVSTETSVMHKVDPETLESTKRVRYNVTRHRCFGCSKL